MLRKIVLVCIVVGFFATTGWGETPYYSIDTGSFSDVTLALKKPEWLYNYTKINFVSVHDETLFGCDDYHQSAQDMFYHKAGDCEDYAAFNNYVLALHGYNPVAWYLSTSSVGHVTNVFKYKGEWYVIDNNVFKGCSTEEEAKELSLSNYVLAIPYFCPTYHVDGALPSNQVGAAYLPMEDHLMAQTPGFQFFIPIVGYTKALHKEAIGVLVPVNSQLLKEVGVSISDHGFYSSSIETNERMYSLHLASKFIGVSLHTGDYDGVTVDLQFIRSEKINAYICSRSGTVVDWLISLDLKTVKFNVSTHDKVVSAFIEFDFGGIGNREISLKKDYCNISYTEDSVYLLVKYPFNSGGAK